jgi:hypothetical protein
VVVAVLRAREGTVISNPAANINVVKNAADLAITHLVIIGGWNAQHPAAATGWAGPVHEWRHAQGR